MSSPDFDTYKKIHLNAFVDKAQFIGFLENCIEQESDIIKYSYHKITIYDWIYSIEDLADLIKDYYSITFLPVHYTIGHKFSTFYTCNLNLILQAFRSDFKLPFQLNQLNVDIIFNDKSSVDLFESKITLEEIITGVVTNRLTENYELNLSNFCNDSEFLDKNINFYRITLLSMYKRLMLRMAPSTKFLNLSNNNLVQIPSEILNFFIRSDLIGINLGYNKIPSMKELVRVSSRVEKLWLEGNPLCSDLDAMSYLQEVAKKFPRLKELFIVDRNNMEQPTNNQENVAAGGEHVPSAAEQMVVTGPAHPQYSTTAARLATFEDWPRALAQRPPDLADAGFFYTGQGDKTKCFYCDGGLKDWEDGDVPWEQHAIWFDRCAFLLLVKGCEYVQSVVTEASAIGSSAPAPAAPASALGYAAAQVVPGGCEARVEEGSLCRICYDNPRNVSFVPCGHVVACARCTLKSDKCPTCRRTYTNVLRLYYSQHNPTSWSKTVAWLFHRTIEWKDGITLNHHGINCPFWRNYIVKGDLMTRMFAEKFVTLYFTHYDCKPRKNIASLYDEKATFSISTQLTDAEAEHYSQYSRNLLHPEKNHLVTSSQQIYKTQVAIVAILSMLPETVHDPSTFTIDVLKHDENCAIIIVDGIYKELYKSSTKSDRHYQFRRTFVFTISASHSAISYHIKHEMFTIAFATAEQIKNSFKKQIINLNTPALVNPKPHEIEALCKTYRDLTNLRRDEAKYQLEYHNWDIVQALQTFSDNLKSDKISLHSFKDSDLESISDDLESISE